MDKFLELEYKLSLEQARYYDDRQWNVVRLAVTISTISGTILLAISNYQKSLYLFLEVIPYITFLIGFCLLFLLLILVQNRLYFVYQMRQVNAIRKKMVEETNFKENQLYLKTDFSAFKWMSTHSLMYLFVSTVASAYFTVTQYTAITKCFYYTAFTFISIFLALFLFCGIYLKCQSGKKSDRSIHSAKS